MLTSIGKYSKSFFIKLLVGIIILPFVFWGMGDVFRGGNQNIIVTIDSEKISTQEFLNYLNNLNLNKKEVEELKKTGLLEKILSEYVGKKIIGMEVEKFGIKVTDQSLKNIIMNDKTFYKDGKFSRTAYEKFLLSSGITAPTFEKNIVEQEKRLLLLKFLSDGTVIPDYLVEIEFRKENQTKLINYINLDNYYNQISINDVEIEKVYNENKNSFKEEFKEISFVELTPSNIVGETDYNELFFKKINKIENDILDGISLKDIIKSNNLNLSSTKLINKNLKDEKNMSYNLIDKNLFKNIFDNELNKLELIIVNEKYFLAQITKNNIRFKNISNKDVNNIIKKQIKLKQKFDNNTKIAKQIALKEFDQKKMQEFAVKNKLLIKSTKIDSLKNNEIFTEGIIKRIFETNDGEINLITNTLLSKNFLVFTKNTSYKSLNTTSKEYEKYKSKAKLNLAQKIFETYDKSVNKKYKITLNNKVIDRLKNSF